MHPPRDPARARASGASPACADDLELVRAALRGERAAVDRLERRLRCVPVWLAFLDRRAGKVLEHEDLRDLAQEVLVTLWSRLPTYTGEAALEPWARGYCVNGFRNAVRKTQRRARLLAVAARWSAGRAPDPAPSFDPERLQALLARLSEEEARTIRLKCFESLTFEEIGARLGIPSGTAKTCYYRGLRSLAVGLGREEAQ